MLESEESSLVKFFHLLTVPGARVWDKFKFSAFTVLRGASKTKLKNVNKKRMATARRQNFFEISQGIHC
jgi:hypothetical protein